MSCATSGGTLARTLPSASALGNALESGNASPDPRAPSRRIAPTVPLGASSQRPCLKQHHWSSQRECATPATHFWPTLRRLATQRRRRCAAGSWPAHRLGHHQRKRRNCQGRDQHTATDRPSAEPFGPERGLARCAQSCAPLDSTYSRSPTPALRADCPNTVRRRPSEALEARRAALATPPGSRGCCLFYTWATPPLEARSPSSAHP